MARKITSKELEERSKKIFNSLGLKDLDIKVYKNINGEQSSRHIHVDKNGAKVEEKSGEQAAKTVIPDNQVCSGSQEGPKDKSAERLNKAMSFLGQWLGGNITEDDFMGNMKSMFEERCKEKFGNLDPMKLVSEIDKSAKEMIDNPIWKGFVSGLKELGVPVGSEDFSEAAKKLKEAWGYIPSEGAAKHEEPKHEENSCNGQSACCKTKTVDDSEPDSEQPSTPSPKPMTKAEEIREMIKKERAKEDREHLVIQEIFEKLDRSIENRVYKTFDQVGNKDAAGIVLFLPQIYSAPASDLKDLYTAAGERIQNEYGFKSYSLALPCLATNNMWRFKFFF